MPIGREPGVWIARPLNGKFADLVTAALSQEYDIKVKQKALQGGLCKELSGNGPLKNFESALRVVQQSKRGKQPVQDETKCARVHAASE